MKIKSESKYYKRKEFKSFDNLMKVKNDLNSIFQNSTILEFDIFIKEIKLQFPNIFVSTQQISKYIKASGYDVIKKYSPITKNNKRYIIKK